MSNHLLGTKPYFYTLSATADIELSQVLPCNVKYFEIRAKDVNAELRFSFYDSGTSDINENYFTIPKGNSYSLNRINFAQHILYLRSTKTTKIEVFVLT